MFDDPADPNPHIALIQDLVSYKNPKGFRGRSSATTQLWWIVQATLFRWSPRFMFGWRRAILRLFGAKIGRNTLIRPGVRVLYPWNLTVGDHSWIGDDSKIYNMAKITIGSNVAIAEDVHLISGSHMFWRPDFGIFAEPIEVENQSWLCNGVFVHQGVTIREGSIIGARSMVTRSTEPYSINVGSPTQYVGDRRRQTPDAWGKAVRDV